MKKGTRAGQNARTIREDVARCCAALRAAMGARAADGGSEAAVVVPHEQAPVVVVSRVRPARTARGNYWEAGGRGQ